MMKVESLIFIGIFTLLFACNQKSETFDQIGLRQDKIEPTLKTSQVPHDTDDPAIWYNKENPEKSLILGTDKDDSGALYVFDLSGKIIDSLVVDSLEYPNNVDVEYGLVLPNGNLIDIAVTVERSSKKLRVFSVPDLRALDGGGFPAFLGEAADSLRLPMGVGLFKNPEDSTISVIVSRKIGPTDGTYLWQYSLNAVSEDLVELEVIRKFGNFSGGGSEIEAILVDDELGYIYYSDEAYGIRKYYADPINGNHELTVFGQNDFKEDREGIALWPTSPTDGFLIVSDQQDSSFNVYPRNPNNGEHFLIKKWHLSTVETDGCDLISLPTSERFSAGFFIAMSEDRTFHLYDLGLFMK